MQWNKDLANHTVKFHAALSGEQQDLCLTVISVLCAHLQCWQFDNVSNAVLYAFVFLLPLLFIFLLTVVFVAFLY